MLAQVVRQNRFGDPRTAFQIEEVEIPDLNAKIAALLGTTVDQVTLQDVAVNPKSGAVYLSVERGSGAAAQPVMLRADRSGGLTAVGRTCPPSISATSPCKTRPPTGTPGRGLALGAHLPR